MNIDVKTIPRYEKVQMILFGIVLALLAFVYGIYSFVQASCTLLGRGNPPIGTFITFYGVEARLISTIYIGAGIWLFSGSFLSKFRTLKYNGYLSWIGAITLMFGLCSLVIILSLPLFQ